MTSAISIAATLRGAGPQPVGPVAAESTGAANIYHIGDWIDDLCLATGLLTRVPVPHPHGAAPDNLARAQRVFPLIGVGIGLAVGLVYLALIALRLPPLAAAALALVASALLTGALHEDGLGDVADGFGGGRDRDAKLSIMRDSRLGTYGALAVLSAFVVKAAALAVLGGATAVGALVAAHALGRAVVPLLAIGMPHARSDGLGHSAGRPAAADVAIAAGIAAVSAFVCLTLGQALMAIILAALGAGLVAVIAKRQIGGVTGDVFGAAEQVVEIAVLLLVARAV